MRLKESEIFEEYVKAAEAKGLVKESDYADSRIGSDTIDIIEMLYGVKPEGEKKSDSQYSPILDKAHPETTVVGPAYDRLNGIVEDLKQRQSLMAGIARKTPDGALTQRRYIAASQDLLDTLVRVGFTLDNEDHDELTRFADNCADRLIKEAQGWIVGSIAAVLGLVALINHTDNSRQNVVQNSQQVLDQLKDLSNNPLAPSIEQAVSNLQTMAQNIQPIEANIATIQGLIDASQVHGDDLQQMSNYHLALEKMAAKIPQWQQELSSTANQSEQSSDFWEKVKDVAHFFVGSDTDDVVHALGGLNKAISFAINEINMYMKQAAKIDKPVASYIQQNPSVTEAAPPQPGSSGIAGEFENALSELAS